MGRGSVSRYRVGGAASTLGPDGTPVPPFVPGGGATVQWGLHPPRVRGHHAATYLGEGRAVDPLFLLLIILVLCAVGGGPWWGWGWGWGPSGLLGLLVLVLVIVLLFRAFGGPRQPL
jgi:hypothetical protein